MQAEALLEELTGTRTNEISGFRRGIYEVFTRLECYAALLGS